MASYDTASSNLATHVTVNDAALRQIQAEQTKGLEEMRSSLENIFSGSGMFTALQNLVNNHERSIKELEDKLKSGSAFTTGDRRTQYSRSVLDFKALSDIKTVSYTHLTLPTNDLV